MDIEQLKDALKHDVKFIYAIRTSRTPQDSAIVLKTERVSARF